MRWCLRECESGTGPAESPQMHAVARLTRAASPLSCSAFLGTADPCTSRREQVADAKALAKGSERCKKSKFLRLITKPYLGAPASAKSAGF
jgi:hypothetical protein